VISSFFDGLLFWRDEDFVTKADKLHSFIKLKYESTDAESNGVFIINTSGSLFKAYEHRGYIDWQEGY